MGDIKGRNIFEPYTVPKPQPPTPITFQWDVDQEPLGFLRDQWDVLRRFAQDQSEQIEERLRRFVELYGMGILQHLEIVYDPPEWKQTEPDKYIFTQNVTIRMKEKDE